MHLECRDSLFWLLTLAPPNPTLGGVHHWDENGLYPGVGKEPAFIRHIHTEEVKFVKAWLADYPSSPSSHA